MKLIVYSESRNLESKPTNNSDMEALTESLLSQLAKKENKLLGKYKNGEQQEK